MANQQHSDLNIELTFDAGFDEHITDVQKQSLEDVFVAKLKEIVSSSDTLDILDGPTQRGPLPGRHLVNVSIKTKEPDVPSESEEEDGDDNPS